METLVLTATAVLSVVVPLLRVRGRAFYVLFLHLLVLLTVGSLAIRTLSGGGTLLIPFVDSWPQSPLMYLTNLKAYGMLAVSALSVSSVCAVKGRIIWALPNVSVHDPSALVNSPYTCLLVIWFHLGAIVLLALG